MLKIINNLEPFFEDCYRRINVREYAKILHISPPTASKLLAAYHTQNLLKKETYRRYILYYADKESHDFIDLSRIYWRRRIKSLMDHIEERLARPTLVLFGSLAKAEVKPDSDLDLAILGQKTELNLTGFEKQLKRKIQVFWFNSLQEIPNRELANNILNGYTLRGRLSL